MSLYGQFTETHCYCTKEWCPDCGACHDCGHKKVHALGIAGVKTPAIPSKSQKVKGLIALSKLSGMGQVLTINKLLKKGDTIPTGSCPGLFPQFARPCPVRPRHGFVDSRPVKNWAEVKKVFEETLKAEPEGELMLTPLIKASMNAIWTPTLITVGEGNDGATAGKDCTSIPIFPVDGAKDYSKAFKDAGVGADEAPYIEVVYGDKRSGYNHTLTQLRAGTPIPANCGPDYLPTTVEVTEVIKTNGEDLLEWEKVTIGLEGKKGVVVWHPGGSMADHYAVHARSRHIPLVTSFEPQVGETLVPTEEDEPAEVPSIRYVRVTAGSRPDPKSVLEGLMAAEKVDLDTANDSLHVYMLLMGLHYSAAMGGEYGKWIGAAAAMMIRLGSVALTGEARHWNGSHLHGFTREQAWTKAWGRSLTFHRANLSRLAQVFRYGHWPSSGFGGKNWARCAYALAPIFTAIAHLAKNKDDESVGELIRALNVAVNQAHNGGWWLNKFANGDAMDYIQKGDMNYILQTVPAFMEVELARRKLTPAEITKTAARWARWRDMEIKSPKIEKAEMLFVPGIPGIQFSFKTKLLSDHYKQITVPFSKLGDLILPNLGEVYLVPTKGGWKIEARPGGGDPLTLWEEDAFEVAPRTIRGGRAQD